MAKKFFYVTAGMLMLALTYHLGARSATAQAGGSVVGVAAYFYQPGGAGEYVVATSSGDVYRKQTGGQWQYQGNALGAGPTITEQQTWGQVKDKYRK